MEASQQLVVLRLTKVEIDKVLVLELVLLYSVTTQISRLDKDLCFDVGVSQSSDMLLSCAKVLYVEI